MSVKPFGQTLGYVDNTGIDSLDQHDRRFSLSKDYEDRNDFGASFRYYNQGNRLKMTASSYQVGKMTRELRTRCSVCAAEALLCGTGAGIRRAT